MAVRHWWEKERGKKSCIQQLFSNEYSLSQPVSNQLTCQGEIATFTFLPIFKLDGWDLFIHWPPPTIAALWSHSSHVTHKSLPLPALSSKHTHSVAGMDSHPRECRLGRECQDLRIQSVLCGSSCSSTRTRSAPSGNRLPWWVPAWSARRKGARIRSGGTLNAELKINLNYINTILLSLDQYTPACCWNIVWKSSKWLTLL